MSSMQREKGILKLIDTDLSIEEFAKQWWDKNQSKELPEYYENYTEAVFQDMDIFYTYNNKIYKKELCQVDSEDDIYEGEKLTNGDIKILTQFYNGGSSINEALDNCMRNTEK